MNEVIFLFFVMMTFRLFYFSIRHLITSTLHENVMMAKCGRLCRSYENILRNNIHHCDGHFKLVLHTVFQI